MLLLHRTIFIFCLLILNSLLLAQGGTKPEKIDISEYRVPGLPKHLTLMDRLKKSNPFNRYHFSYSEKNALLWSELTESPRNHIAFVEPLNFKEREELRRLYQKKDFLWKLFLNAYRRSGYGEEENQEAIRAYFHDRHRYVIISESQSSTEVTKLPENKDPLDPSHLDIQAEPIGGKSNFIRAVALNTELTPGLSLDDLPPIIEFTCVIHGGNKIEGLKLKSVVTGDEEKQDSIYEFLGKLRSNILNFSRDQYPWKAGKKDGENVPSNVTLRIPIHYFEH